MEQQNRKGRCTNFCSVDQPTEWNLGKTQFLNSIAFNFCSIVFSAKNLYRFYIKEFETGFLWRWPLHTGSLTVPIDTTNYLIVSLSDIRILFNFSAVFWPHFARQNTQTHGNMELLCKIEFSNHLFASVNSYLLLVWVWCRKLVLIFFFIFLKCH